MVVDELVDAICTALLAEFGPEVRRYVGEVPQGLVEPCFLILELETAQIRRIGPRYRLERSFDILYFPAAEDPKALSEMAQKLFFALETPSAQSGEMFRGSGMRAEIQDGVLHTFVTYRYDLIDAGGEQAMEFVAVTEMTKGG